VLVFIVAVILAALAGELIRAEDPHRALLRCDPEQVVFELYLPDIEEEMFLAAAHRLVDRMGMTLLRINVPDGRPNLVLCIGSTLDQARQSAITYYRDQEVMFD